MLENSTGECLKVIAPWGETLEVPVLSEKEMKEALDMFISCAPPYSHATNNFKLMFYYLFMEQVKLKKELQEMRESQGVTKEFDTRSPMKFGSNLAGY